jgi:hypothetical protein
VAFGAGAGDERRQQQAPDLLSPALGVHRDRDLGDVGSDEPVARLVGGEEAEPRRADRFVETVERDDCEVALAAPAFDVAPQLGQRELLLERWTFLGAVVAPVHGFVEHLREEGGIGACAQTKHTGRLWPGARSSRSSRN